VFIVSDFGGESCDEVLAITESLHGNTAPKREAGKGAPAGVGSGFTASSYGGYERGCGTLRSEGGDIGGGSETLAVDVYNGELTGDTAATVTSATGIANASGPKVVQPIAIQGSMIGRKEKNGPQGSGYSEDGTSFTLTKTDQHAVCSWNGDVTPKSSEDLSVTLRSQQGGEGVGVATFDARGNGDGDTSCTLTGDHQSRVTDYTSLALQQDNPQMNATLYQEDGKTVEGMCEMRGATMVRRLTPMECERLQGFPDGWTSKRCILELEGNQWKPTGKVEEQKDGPRYRQMGNAVSVPVAEYLGHRMAQAV